MSHKDWKNGDRVQKSDWNSGKEVITTGAITDVVTATRERQRYNGYGYNSKVTETETYIEKVSVKWDDGKEEIDVSPWLVPEDSALEREFRIKASEINALIQEKLAIASNAIDEAEAIAEANGVSFHASVSPLSQSYTARSAKEKWPGLSEEFMNDITETHGEYDGWRHSAVCY